MASSTQINPQHTYTSPGGVIQLLGCMLLLIQQVTLPGTLFYLNKYAHSVVNIEVLMVIYYAGDLSTSPLQATVTDAEHAPGQPHYKWNVYFITNNMNIRNLPDCKQNCFCNYFCL